MIGLRRLIFSVFAAGVCLVPTAPSWAVPSFARQTGMACSACHTVFPELSPFGREFKLNGYVLDNLKQVTGIDIDSKQTLSLNQIPPISLMLQVSYTHTSAPLPDSALNAAGDTGVSPRMATFSSPNRRASFTPVRSPMGWVHSYS